MPEGKIKGIDFVGVGVCYFCHDGKGRFVMGKRSSQARDEHGRWDIGAGAMEFEDSVEQTLRKEIKEEYCTEVLGSEFLGFRDIFREHNGQKTHWIQLDYKVLVSASLVKNGEPHKMDEVKWFSFDDMPPEQLMHSQWPVFWGKYKEKLKF